MSKKGQVITRSTYEDPEVVDGYIADKSSNLKQKEMITAFWTKDSFLEKTTALNWDLENFTTQLGRPLLGKPTRWLRFIFTTPAAKIL